MPNLINCLWCRVKANENVRILCSLMAVGYMLRSAIASRHSSNFGWDTYNALAELDSSNHEGRHSSCITSDTFWLLYQPSLVSSFCITMGCFADWAPNQVPNPSTSSPDALLNHLSLINSSLPVMTICSPSPLFSSKNCEQKRTGTCTKSPP
jgi:hypothetical protein